MIASGASGDSDASGANEDRRGMGEEKKYPMPRIEEKEEAREEKREENGAWEKKKIPHALN